MYRGTLILTGPPDIPLSHLPWNRWHARLGFQRNRFFRVSLKSIVPDGGVIPCIKVVLKRRHQTRYVWTQPR